MALLRSRLLFSSIRKQIPIGSRFYANESQNVPEVSQLATGVEKWQLEQELAGNQDPFKMRAIKRHPSSKSNPIMVPSYYDCRIVGCVCEEDSCSIIWMWVFKGEPRRCYCGHWFKLQEYKPV